MCVPWGGGGRGHGEASGWCGAGNGRAMAECVTWAEGGRPLCEGEWRSSRCKKTGGAVTGAHTFELGSQSKKKEGDWGARGCRQVSPTGRASIPPPSERWGRGKKREHTSKERNTKVWGEEGSMGLTASSRAFSAAIRAVGGEMPRSPARSYSRSAPASMRASMMGK
jgi:hypothetical protein